MKVRAPRCCHRCRSLTSAGLQPQPPCWRPCFPSNVDAFLVQSVKTSPWPCCVSPARCLQPLGGVDRPSQPPCLLGKMPFSLSLSAALLLYSGSTPPLSRSALCFSDALFIYLFIFLTSPVFRHAPPPLHCHWLAVTRFSRSDWLVLLISLDSVLDESSSSHRRLPYFTVNLRYD